MYDSIPFADFFISERLRIRLSTEPSVAARLALATGASCENEIEKVSLMVVLTGDQEGKVAQIARRTLKGIGADRLCKILPTDSHEQLLAFLVDFFVDNPRLDERFVQCIHLPSISVRTIARRASPRVCEEIARAHQMLLLTPETIFDLEKNGNCPASAYSRAESFLRMQGALPTKDKPLNKAPPAVEQLSSAGIDLEAEIMAALSGGQSPSLVRAQENFKAFVLSDNDASSSSSNFDGFQLDHEKDSKMGFSFDLSGFEDEDEDSEDGPRESWEKKIKDMSVGHRIKLAFKGNKECRAILIRDTNKTVSVAVVKSGRLTDGEVTTHAGNRNLSDDVIREISRNSEFVRKYPVKVALINNPKTPVATALGFLSSLHKKELKSLMRNRNVPSVISLAARKRFKDKFQKS